MKRIKGILLIIMGIFALALAPNASAEVSPWYVENMSNNEALLQAGTTTYCDKNFVVENMGSEQAEVQVIMGNGANYTFDQIEPKGKKAYTLSSEGSFAGGWEETKNTRIDEARIINSTGGNSQLKVHCK